MKARFELDPEAVGKFSPSRLVDPVPYDTSEQHFAASLEEKPPQHCFVVDEDPPAHPQAEDRNTRTVPNLATVQAIDLAEHQPSAVVADPVESSKQRSATNEGNRDLLPASSEEWWRNEVAAKVHRYRARTRLRSPRYPSLQLKFDVLDSAPPVRSFPSVSNTAALPQEEAVAQESCVPEVHPAVPAEELSLRAITASPTGKILEFPAPFVPATPAADELAGPVLDRPRILEVPEVVPPPPALGGILIEPEEQPVREKRQGFELPLVAALFSRRMLAAGIDGFIVAAAVALFSYTFFRMTAVVPIRQMAGVAGGVFAILWAGYQYLLLVHTAATPGLKLAGLQLSRFDGTSVPRKLRRWRVLASLLSGLSLGLGYAWCFLDEDQLCWHDRITHTYMAPRASK